MPQRKKTEEELALIKADEDRLQSHPVIEPIPSIGGLASMLKSLGIPAMVILMAGLLMVEKQGASSREALMLKEISSMRVAQTEERREFVTALNKISIALDGIDKRVEIMSRGK